MKATRIIALPFALLLMTGADAQDHQHQMPGMQMPAQTEQKKPTQQQPAQPGPAGAPGMQTPQGALPTIEQQQQANPQHEMQMQNLEMRSPETTPSRVIDLQEPENPDRKTGDNVAVPDLLENARKSEPKRIEEFEQLSLKNNPTLKQAASYRKPVFSLSASSWPVAESLHRISGRANSRRFIRWRRARRFCSTERRLGRKASPAQKCFRATA